MTDEFGRREEVIDPLREDVRAVAASIDDAVNALHQINADQMLVRGEVNHQLNLLREQLRLGSVSISSPCQWLIFGVLLAHVIHHW
jgi:hypothetical protein